jgi:uncharacterized membrane protein
VALVYNRRADSRGKREAELQQSRAMRAKQARPSAEFKSRLPGTRRAYRFAITNTGEAAATDLNANLMDAGDNMVSDEFRPNGYDIGVLMPKESREVDVAVKAELSERNPLSLQITWYDDSGSNNKKSRVRVPRT